MKIHKLRDLALVSSNVAGSAYSEYAAGTTYATGNNVKVSFESDGTTPVFPVKEYQSLADSNTGNYPPDDPVNWIELGAENRCKMFDQYVNTQTENAADIEVVIDANGAESIGIFGLYGTAVTLELIRNAETIKSKTIDLRTLIPEAGWYSWLYDAYEYGLSQVIWEFPRYISGATLEITITARSGAAACGMVVLGNASVLGSTRYDAKVGIDDYSIKATDSLGRAYLHQGNYANRADIDMWILNTHIDYVSRQLTAIRGIPAIFDCNNSGSEYQSLSIYGYVQNFDIIISGPLRSKCSLEIKGLI